MSGYRLVQRKIELSAELSAALFSERERERQSLEESELSAELSAVVFVERERERQKTLSDSYSD